MFTGVHERQLDERGRVALPATFRSHLGDSCYLTYGEDACVKVLSEDAFRREAEELIDEVKAGTSTRKRQRAFASSVATVVPDKQGRITLDQRLREYAGIGVNESVVVVGVLDRIEVWNPDQFAAEESAGAVEMSGSRASEGDRS